MRRSPRSPRSRRSPRPPEGRLVLAHPDLGAPVRVAAGEVVVLDDARGPMVVATLLGRDPRGVVHLDGRRLRSRRLAARVRRGLAVVSGAPVAADVTVLDHLAAVVGAAGARRLLDSAPLLRGRGADPAGVLSGGERRVLDWLRAGALEPRVVVLDGAGEGLDARALDWAGARVGDWAAHGVAVVVRAGRLEEQAWAAPAPDDASPGRA